MFLEHKHQVWLLNQVLLKHKLQINKQQNQNQPQVHKLQIKQQAIQEQVRILELRQRIDQQQIQELVTALKFKIQIKVTNSFFVFLQKVKKY